ncbi:type VI secretion system contractile sheath small subunit [Chitinophagaceae bacterium 26-R-25]|nr:type VI secretion system contractile sheath small subunit [Chitinophagaceae bacterium 26-R-25]
MKFLNFIKTLKANVFSGLQKRQQLNTHPGKTLVKSARVNINISQTKQNAKTMALYEFGVGGNEIKVDASEAVNEIQPNKTLVVSQLTNDDPLQPEKVEGLKTVDEVFKHFKPSIEVAMEDAEGQTVHEELKFANLGDFTPKNITGQSSFLNALNLQHREYTEIAKQLRTNKVLQSMLANADSKEALIAALKEFAQQLESAK